MNNDFNPLVSVVIPVYRGANFVREAIDSALEQTYQNVEILVINDGSDDDGATENAVLSYGDKIRYFSKPNGGVSSALNMGIREMQGELFSWLSHDDLYTPEKIENQIKILRERPDKEREVMLMCSVELIDEKREKIPRPVKAIQGEFSGIEIFKLCQRSLHSVLNGCAMLIPKSILNCVGFFDESLRYIQDCEYWYRVMIKGFPFVCTCDKSYLSRVHKGQVTARFPDLYYTESEIMARRLFDVFFQDTKYEVFLKSYLCGCCKTLNPVAVEAISRLKEKKKFTPMLRLKTAFFYMVGHGKNILKKLYSWIFLRNKR